MIKAKTKFVQTSFEVEELGDKNHLFIDGKYAKSGDELNVRINGDAIQDNPNNPYKYVYIMHEFDNFLNQRNGENVTEYSARLVSLSTKNLSDSQLATVIGKLAEAEQEYNRSYKGMHFVDGGRIDIQKMEEALAANKKVFINAHAERQKYYADVSKSNIAVNHEQQVTRELEQREEDKTNQQIRFMKAEVQEHTKAAAPLVQAQKEANHLKSKELDMTTLDVNEFLAIDIIAKYKLQNSKEFDEFVNKFKSGDVDVVKDYKQLTTSLKKDGKYSDKGGNAALQAGVNSLISENSQAIAKYIEGKNALNSIDNISPGYETGKVNALELTK